MVRFWVLLLPCTLLAQEPFRDPALSAEQRAVDLVSRLTLEEKVLQMQNAAPAIPRLGIPAYDWWNEALHGVARAGRATVFPQAIGLAATWDTALMLRIADAISTEARAKYNEAIRNDDRRRYHGLTFWSPNINIFRDPRWGRGQETYGEDPFLTARFAVAFIKGMQGDDPHYFKAIATPKHYAVHSGPEPLRHSFNVELAQRDLEETYLPAFRAAIAEGKADSIMCAYNAVDGVPACASTDLLQHRLRGQWGFEGYVVSDCGAITDIARGHKFKPTLAEASAAAVRAGTDLTCGNEYRTLPDAVKQGKIPEADIDRALQRLFTARFRLGMFDPPERVPFSRIPATENDSPLHRRLARDAARASIVLLKNDRGTLPLGSSARRIAVIGPAADDPDVLLGNYNGTPSRSVTPLEGMRRRFGAAVRFAAGSTYTAASTALVPADAFPEGLQAEYFDNADLTGAPKRTRRESRVDFDWDSDDPAISAAIPRAAFSVRWTGTFQPPFSGGYTLASKLVRCAGCFGAAGVRVFLDGRPVLEDTGRRAQRAAEAPVPLEAGRAYALRVEFRANGGAAGLELGWIPPAAPLLAQAAQAVRDSDLAVAFLGLNSSLEGEEMNVNIPGFAGGDRTDLRLPEPQRALLAAALDTGKPVVVVLLSGSAIAATEAAERAAAVLEAWYPGEEGGSAIADVLAGDYNPAGRLPVTFYRSTDQLPPFSDYSMIGRTYRYFKDRPLYPFGFGLSYSTFRYSQLGTRSLPDGLLVTARVRNVSSRAADEVVQLYVSRGGPDDAIRDLRGFDRIRLRPHEDRIVSFQLSAADVAPRPGKVVRISVGGGQPMPGVQFVETVLK